MKIRSTNRVYTPVTLSENMNITLDGDILHYIRNVLRLKVGDRLRLFNEQSGEFLANIVDIGKKELCLEVERRFKAPSYVTGLSIALCLIKNDKMSDMVSMLVQLGVTEIIPIISEYTVNRNFNRERFERIAQEATEQCERLDVPTVLDPISLENLLQTHKFDYVIYANENESANGKLSTEIAKNKNIVMIVGPEGGFSDKELDILDKVGAISVTLGPNILRAETAAVKLVSYVQFLRDFDASK